MAHLDLQRSTFNAAETLIHGRSSRRIGHNTTLVNRGPDHYAVRYWNTDIVTIGRDGWLTIDTAGWDTVTTWQRVNALLPGPFRIGSHRVRGESTRWLYAGGYPITPYVDGLQVNAADGTVGYAGDVILTADDIAAIRTAAEDAAAERARKHAALMLRQHPTARSFSPDASGLFAQYSYGPGGPHRGGYDGAAADCTTCTTERAEWRTLRADALARAHDGLTVTTRNGSDTTDVVSTYPAHSTFTRYYGAPAGISDCPRCSTPTV